jgi:exoribonuclease R
MPYRLRTENRHYSDFKIYEEGTFVEVKMDILPYKFKMFNFDTFVTEPCIKILHSTVRSMTCIPGVLVLQGNRTFGKHKNRSLYQCIPDDKRIPTFLVPYKVKANFNKLQANLYVTFRYETWCGKHPRGILTNVLGNVNKLEIFYEYQLYCKSLNASIQNFSRDTAMKLKLKTENEFIDYILDKFKTIKDLREKSNIFCVDPIGSADFDDGMSIDILSEDEYKIAIYIANVPIWMEILQIWDSFSDRISTIYLPDRRRPMLPTCLSECLCSLIEKRTRFSFVCELTIKKYEIVGIDFYNAAICVSKNYRYESDELMKNYDYLMMLDVVQQINKKTKYIPQVKNSHDVVAYLMIAMNYYSAKELVKKKKGIYRSAIIRDVKEIPGDLPKDISKFIKIWNSNGGQYIPYSEEMQHDILELESYIHITSPIRRLVDLLNMLEIQMELGLIEFGDQAQIFFRKWMEKLDYINATMRAIKKIQSDCSLLNICLTDKSVMEKEYEGYVFDKIKRNDGLYQYVVYLPDLKLVSRLKERDELANYERCKFTLYVFNDEDRLKKKIRIQKI